MLSRLGRRLSTTHAILFQPSLSRHVTTTQRARRASPSSRDSGTRPSLLAQYARLIFSPSFGLTFIYTALSFLILFTKFPYTVRAINGASMSPTLSPELLDGSLKKRKDYVVFRRLRPGKLEVLGGDSGAEEEGKEKDARTCVRRGQLVLLAAPHDPDKFVVKRVVGLPGDVVVPLAKNKKLFRGAATTSKGGAKACPRFGMEGDQQQQEPQPITVPFGHLWVEGDNPAASFDSNDYGPVSQGLVTEVAYGHARLPWRIGAWQRKRWEIDGWEAHMSVSNGGKKAESRLRKREDSLEWKGDGVPEEWRMYAV